ncbi:FUSC family protein [Kaistia dalseonensis]|uniref:Integral membrane bound transporter domain-containing protein n=1 Tax=Kaistia dalseonensis TaxID=410840 RepID=A0ABU0H2I9_9HYPH|nr:FUSC family protein [Kaistia dalseonensis]MCX5493149.1 FUSC family protein [Kaistia dalseonensis]MDQ0435704.1 hypothetical protein [Kaistia dalseonensis]
MPSPEAPRSGEGAIAAQFGMDGAMAERSIRFTLTVMAPIALTMITGPQSWLLYAIVAAIVAFAGDAGGPPLARLGWMATGPAALALGLVLGSLAIGHAPFVIILSMTAGLLYGLVETAHPHLLLATRFFAFGIVLAGLVSPAIAIDYWAIAAMLLFAWALSLALDLGDRKLRPLNVPGWAEVMPSIERAVPNRWLFAASVALAIGLALVITELTGSVRPSWACLTILMVLRSEITSSVRLAIERVVGTFGGVLVAVLIGHYAEHRTLVIAMGIAAFVRWPAQQVHNALGVFCLTVFVLLMIELSTTDHAMASILLKERLTDTLIGAIAAGIGVGFYDLARSLIDKRRSKA